MPPEDLEKQSDQNYDLEALMEAITPDNFPDNLDFGESVGKEVW